MKNAWEDFIESLKDLDDIQTERSPTEVPDKDAEIIDEYLAKWITENYPNFEFNPKTRDKMVELFKRAKKVGVDYPLYVYVDALLNMCYDRSEDLLSAMRAVFILGYAMRTMTETQD